MVQIQYTEYRTREGDTWDYVAWLHYGTTELTEHIVRANPHVPLVTEIPAGIVLAVPILTRPAAQLTDSQRPPWRAKA